MDGTTTASFIVILVVGAIVGALVGAMLGGYLPPVGVALGAGIIATVVAAVIRNKLVNRASGAGPDEARIPTVLIVFGLIGAIAGSLASLEVLNLAGGDHPSAFLGAVAGIGSAIMVGSLMVTYHTNPEPPRR